jgi:hypothetical protein
MNNIKKSETSIPSATLDMYDFHGIDDRETSVKSKNEKEINRKKLVPFIQGQIELNKHLLEGAITEYEIPLIEEHIAYFEQVLEIINSSNTFILRERIGELRKSLSEASQYFRKVYEENKHHELNCHIGILLEGFSKALSQDDKRALK